MNSLKRTDLDGAESKTFCLRNLNRLFTSLVEDEPILRIKLLILRRKFPKLRSLSLVRMAARAWLKEQLRDASLGEVDNLLRTFIAPAQKIREVHSFEKPLFRKIQR